MCAGAQLVLLLLASALHPSAELTCNGATYPSGSRCCHECQPGYGMKRRCDDQTLDTECQPCQEGYYNDAFNYEDCRPCTQCNERSGSEPAQSCTSTRDTVCHCRPGTQPQGGYKLGVDCTPCPPGQFSPGQNQACKPWTDCSSMGRRTLKPATNSSDAICEDRNPPATTLPRNTQHPSSLPTTAHTGTSQSPPKAPMDLPGGPVPTGPVLSVILGVGVGLLGVTAAALALALNRHTWRPQLAAPKPPGGNSFRTPIQEEHADEHSVLAKV
ncbi:tumor necrosis factor receptor superfamily member 4 [Tenrec ecaudatus]|uniref:tumor necrosis factor receptor superfamily member 4 n=1 Tax=Tenrec ecaudatus TaxID=94439 RepID=UPI003F598094